MVGLAGKRLGLDLHHVPHGRTLLTRRPPTPASRGQVAHEIAPPRRPPIAEAWRPLPAHPLPARTQPPPVPSHYPTSEHPLQWFLVLTCLVMFVLAFLGFTNFSHALPLNDKLLHFLCFMVATGVFYFIFDVEECVAISVCVGRSVNKVQGGKTDMDLATCRPDHDWLLLFLLRRHTERVRAVDATGVCWSFSYLYPTLIRS